MYNFEFDHEVDDASMLLTIQVSYSIWTWDGNYYEPSECSINDYDYKLLSGKLDMTAFFKSHDDQKHIERIEAAIEKQIWNNYENQ